MRPSVFLCCWVLSSVVCLVTGRTFCANQTDMIETLSRQLMLQQLYIEERTRSEGGSGVKQMRVNKVGLRSYHTASHVAGSQMAMHDHANFKGTLGLGEIIAILNGVEFRTRHNDFKLVMPSLTSKDYHATDDIPFTDVPDSVLKETNVTLAVLEMLEYFRAFRDQDPSHRDYTNYFKPVLCYLEGHWTTVTGDLEDPFVSPRHQLDADSWKDLSEKIRYTSATGAKSNLENFAYLPSVVINMKNGLPEIGQWNYRILCHPLKTPVPLARLHVVDDLGARSTYKQTMDEHSKTRRARFQVDPRMDMTEKHSVRRYRGFLDKLMEEIPGVDNYPANLTDDAFGLMAFEVPDKTSDPKKPLNVGYYHRTFNANKAGAMGQSYRHRSFSDDHVFMARTTSSRVPEVCTFFDGKDEQTGKNVKRTECQRWSYAIPLELTFLTPLGNWNPYNLPYKEADRKFVDMGGRNGGMTPEKAYNGTSSSKYYRTPSSIFEGSGSNEDSKADTSNKIVGVLDENGDVRSVGPSSVRITHNIKDVGTFRQRYPIFEVPGQSGAVWKELEVLKDIVLHKAGSRFNFAYYDQDAWYTK